MGENLEAAALTRKAFRREAAASGLLSDDSTSFIGVCGTDSEDPAYLALEHVPWPTLDTCHPLSNHAVSIAGCWKRRPSRASRARESMISEESCESSPPRWKSSGLP